MSYVNYGYDSQRALDSAFNSLSFNKDDKENINLGMMHNNSNNNNNKDTANDPLNNNNNNNNNNIISMNSNTFTYPSNNIPYHPANNNNNNKLNTSTNSNTTNNNNNNIVNNQDITNSLRMDLQIKETQIQALENEIQIYKRLINDDLKSNGRSSKINSNNNSMLNDIDEDDEDTLNKIIIPENVETILTTLATNLKDTQAKLKETEDNLESILTAIALNPTNAVTKDGRYDIETIAHKMIVRLEILTKENKEMAKMLSYGKSKEVHIELNLVRRENDELKEKIKLLEGKIESLSQKE
ncbi:hypothetical protein C6P44_000387 [Monosporozyma unispora]|nr:hypothetical protein C6P44_000387 [Kazachstania unispora]